MASVTEHAQWGVGCLPPLNVDKQAIAAAFSRAAESYDSAANLQRETGHRLVQLGQQHTGLWCWMRVVARGISASIGACWVSGSLPWIWRQVCWIMRANSRSLTTICWGDIEHIPLPDQSVDICFSNLAVQWCSDLGAALSEFYRVTRPGGIILFLPWQKAPLMN